MDEFNKNEKQLFFNQLKGNISELNDGNPWCSVTLKIGHENEREVNFSVKIDMFKNIKKYYALGDKVNIKFYLTSAFKNGRWYSSANILHIENALN